MAEVERPTRMNFQIDHIPVNVFIEFGGYFKMETSVNVEEPEKLMVRTMMIL